ncbi:MAG: VWA domain-containing protein [Candidatus Binatia bacterium]
MDAKLIEFSNLLRENGVRVSVAEDLDALAAARALGLGSREALKNALRTTMVKRSADIAAFDELFDLHFSGIQDLLRSASGRAQSATGLDPAEFQRLLEELEKLLAEHGAELSEMAREWLRNDTGRMEQRIREAIDETRVGDIQRPYQEGQFTHGMANQLGLGDVLREIEAFRERLARMGLDPTLLEELQRYLDSRLRDLAQLLKEVVRQELEKRDLGRRESQRMLALGEKSFFYLTEDEIRRMKEAVAKLAQRLKNVMAIKRKRAKRGKFDVKDTFRKNLQYGGVPFRIQLDQKKKEKPQVVVLCDVSDSVRNVSRFMLQFVYSLQDLYSRVRSFIFVADTGEITRLFEENDIHEAIEQALRGNVINVFAHSDFGRAFKMFHRDYITAVNKRTTVIVLGDARNNYNLPNEWALRDIRTRAKQLIWLNPESRMTWGFGDSEMERYRPFCDVVEECRNLNQLYRVIDRMMVG